MHTTSGFEVHPIGTMQLDGNHLKSTFKVLLASFWAGTMPIAHSIGSIQLSGESTCIDALGHFKAFSIVFCGTHVHQLIKPLIVGLVVHLIGTLQLGGN